MKTHSNWKKSFDLPYVMRMRRLHSPAGLASSILLWIRLAAPTALVWWTRIASICSSWHGDISSASECSESRSIDGSRQSDSMADSRSDPTPPPRVDSSILRRPAAPSGPGPGAESPPSAAGASGAGDGRHSAVRLDLETTLPSLRVTKGWTWDDSSLGLPADFHRFGGDGGVLSSCPFASMHPLALSSSVGRFRFALLSPFFFFFRFFGFPLTSFVRL
mmetsp:Transcript_25863/g.61454  ORF Transcript_25863/g.61454 Transcript_25863/m.61454 type:complete len:219 (+) Transcript_25863:462-1118(+)